MELSKSKKKKLRVARAKKVRLLMDPNQPHLHLLTDEDGNFSNTPRDGYKKRQKIYCKVDFFKISTREQLPHRYFFCKEETQEDGEMLRELIRRINRIKVGVDIPNFPQLLLHNQSFKDVVLTVSETLPKIRFKQILNSLCPMESNRDKPCDPSQVYRFLNIAVIKSGLFKLFGDQMPKLQRCLRMLVARNKMTELVVGDVMRKFEHRRIQWLLHYPPSIRLNILTKVVVWTVFRFCSRLLTSFLHCTESTQSPHQLHYYRKPAWAALVGKEMSQQQRCRGGRGRRLHILKPDEPLQDAPPPRRFRFIAKASLAAVRLIATSAIAQDPASRTGIKTWLSLLRCYSASFPVPSDLSGSLLGTEWAALVRALPPAAPLYWVTADIQDAFGSVKLRKLGRILKSCQEELKPGDRRAAETTSQISLRSMQMTGSLQLGERVTTYYVSQGLLQGDELSSVLSDIYTGHLLATHLLQFFVPPIFTQELFRRGADDLLFVTTDRGRAERFRQCVLAGWPDYNYYCNPAKVLSNCQTGDQAAPALFCGARLLPASREIWPTYNYQTQNIFHTMKGPRARDKPGNFIRTRFLYYCRVRQQRQTPFFGPYNSQARLAVTVSCNISLALRRLTCLLDCLVWGRGRGVLPAWLWATLQAGLKYFIRTAARYGLPWDLVHGLGLRCLQVELNRASQYPAELKKEVARLVAKSELREQAAAKLLKPVKQLVAVAHQEMKYSSITAKLGYKTIASHM